MKCGEAVSGASKVAQDFLTSMKDGDRDITGIATDFTTNTLQTKNERGVAYVGIVFMDFRSNQRAQ